MNIDIPDTELESLIVDGIHEAIHAEATWGEAASYIVAKIKREAGVPDDGIRYRQMTDARLEPDRAAAGDADRVALPRRGGSHRQRWRRIRDGQKQGIVLEVADQDSEVEPTGLVVLSVEVVAQLLADAGWEREIVAAVAAQDMTLLGRTESS